ncbi:MAG: aminopeptidase P N-terminal domain-containing protein [Bacteroidales bacterium]|nr:aminopeptidase P N-terminal domain-containing protein [Bacteroidales bacterium]
MRIQPISNYLFEKNRAKLTRLLPARSAVILCAKDRMPKNGDQYFPYRQDSNFFYLTGIDLPEAILIICPDHPDYRLRELLFIEKTSDHDRTWVGEKLSVEQAKELSGIENIHWLNEFEDFLVRIMSHVSIVYLSVGNEGGVQYKLNTSDYRLYRLLADRFPLHQFQNIAPKIASLRMVKEKEEIEQIEQAITITKKAFYEVIGILEPGIHEYEIEAVITAEFVRNGLQHHAFEPIVASGKNACVLHYTKNSNVCSNNELVLIDFGAEFNNYCADITRTLPVSGRFSSRQRQVYLAVLHLMEKAMQIIRKGISIVEVQRQMVPYIEETLVDLELLTNEEIREKEGSENPAYKEYFMHGIAHFLGLDVHDVGSKEEPLQPGMVITCEPGIYIPEENLGIRLENDLLITEHGVINLSEAIPILPEQIEDLLAR